MKTLQDTIRRGAPGRRDLTEAFIFLLNHQEISGTVNVCLPKPLRNKDLAQTLGRALHRQSFMPAPGFMVKLALREFGTVILQGQKVFPRRLIKSGFVFEYPEIGKALESMIGQSHIRQIFRTR